MKKVYALVSLAVLAVGCSQSATAPSHLSGGGSLNSLASLFDEPKMGHKENSCNSDAPGKPDANAKAYDADKGTASVEFGAIGVWNRTSYKFSVRNNQTGGIVFTDTQPTTLSDAALPPGNYTLTMTGWATGCNPTNPATKTFTMNGPTMAAVVPPLACQTNPGAPNLHCEAKG